VTLTQQRPERRSSAQERVGGVPAVRETSAAEQLNQQTFVEFELCRDGPAGVLQPVPVQGRCGIVEYTAALRENSVEKPVERVQGFYRGNGERY
jgi:hypothetical protein